MKTKARLQKINNNEVTLKLFCDTSELREGKFYTLDIVDSRKQRSLDQNAYLWAVIQEISKVTYNEPWQLYLEGLEKVGVLVEWIETLHEAEKTLKRVYRVVEKKENRGKTALFKCYVGSSHFNTNEMGELINHFVSIAHSYNLNVEL